VNGGTIDAASLDARHSQATSPRRGAAQCCCVFGMSYAVIPSAIH
jgi:hypothetical protein